jgi:branched-chain amino acid transport system substrate-binding protein
MKINNIFFILLAFLLSSCATIDLVQDSSVKDSDYSKNIPVSNNPDISKKITIKKDRKFQVAILLPLSGKNEKIGQSILKSINMSLFNNDKKSKIEFIIFDNKSSNYKSRKAIKEIVKQNIKIVIGPVFSSSVEAISDIVQENNISVISFSNNSDLSNKKGIFLSGFSLEQELERITSYLIDNNRNNFSIIAPSDRYGIRMAKILRETVTAKDANFISSQFYMKNKKDFSKIAQKILNSYIVSVDMEEFQEELELIEDKEERESRELEIISEYKIYTDTILIADNITRSSKIAESLKENNIDGKDIQIVGTNHWNNDKITSYSSLYGSILSSPDNKYYNMFQKKYSHIYNQNPVKISSIGYDVTAFIIDLIYKTKGRSGDITNDIINYNKKRGFNGIDGLFRFLPNGLIERNLAVLEVLNREITVIDQPSGRFIKY